MKIFQWFPKQEWIQQVLVLSRQGLLQLSPERTDKTQNYSRSFSELWISLHVPELISSANTFYLLRGSAGSSSSSKTCREHGSGCILGWKWHCKLWLGNVPFIFILFTFRYDFVFTLWSTSHLSGLPFVTQRKLKNYWSYGGFTHIPLTPIQAGSYSCEGKKMSFMLASPRGRFFICFYI